MLPTFIVIGAKKSGTTSLFHYLRGHSEIWLPEDKRLEFFTDLNWHRGRAWYEAQFEKARRYPARGEITTSYTRFPVERNVPERMHSVVPGVQLVYVVRDPLARIVSHYRYAATEGWERRPIDEAVLGDSAEYVAPSRYAMQLGRFLELFDRAQLFVVVSEDLKADRVTTMARLFEFLGVDATSAPEALERTYLRGEELRRAPGVVQRLRRSGAYRAVRPLLPKRVRDRAWTATTRTPTFAPDRFVLGEAAREEILTRLRPDLVALRDVLGADFHCWGYLDPLPAGGTRPGS